MKVFVDTNILVDVFERRQPYYLDSANIIEQVSALSMPNKDVEDNLQYCSAESAGCDIIITRNPKDFQGNNIRICLPHDFIIDYFQ